MAIIVFCLIQLMLANLNNCERNEAENEENKTLPQSKQKILECDSISVEMLKSYLDQPELQIKISPKELACTLLKLRNWSVDSTFVSQKRDLENPRLSLDAFYICPSECNQGIEQARQKLDIVKSKCGRDICGPLIDGERLRAQQKEGDISKEIEAEAERAVAAEQNTLTSATATLIVESKRAQNVEVELAHRVEQEIIRSSNIEGKVEGECLCINPV